MGRQSRRGARRWAPKDGAQFHFSFPGSVQGFQVTDGEAEIANVVLAYWRSRALRIESSGEARVGSPVFIPSKETAEWFENRVYQADGFAADLSRPDRRGHPQHPDGRALSANVYLSYYGEDDEPASYLDSDTVELRAGESRRLSFTVPALPGPIFSAGVRLPGPGRRGPSWRR